MFPLFFRKKTYDDYEADQYVKHIKNRRQVALALNEEHTPQIESLEICPKCTTQTIIDKWLCKMLVCGTCGEEFRYHDDNEVWVTLHNIKNTRTTK